MLKNGVKYAIQTLKVLSYDSNGYERDIEWVERGEHTLFETAYRIAWELIMKEHCTYRILERRYENGHLRMSRFQISNDIGNDREW